MTKPAPILALIILPIGGVLGALFVLELALRLLYPPPPSITIENAVSDDSKEAFKHDKFTELEDGTLEMETFADWGLYIYTPTGTRLKKNTKAIVRSHAVARADIEIQTNNYGFRYDYLGPKKSTEKRVLVLGDSITLADNAPEEATYTRQAEKFLREQTGNLQIKVINAGVGAIDLQNEFSILLESGLKAEPDVVVVGLYLNDAHTSPTLQLTQVPNALRWSYLARFGFKSFDALRADYADGIKYSTYDSSGEEVMYTEKFAIIEDRFRQLVDGSFKDWGYAWSETYWRRVLPLVDLFKKVTDEKGMELVFMLFPVRYQVEEFQENNEPQQRFSREMAKRGINHLDMLPLLQKEYSTNQTNLFVDHCHYNDEGYQLVGKTLAKHLLENTQAFSK